MNSALISRRDHYSWSSTRVVCRREVLLMNRSSFAIVSIIRTESSIAEFDFAEREILPQP